MLGQIGAQFLAGNSAIRCLLDLGAALRGDLALSLCPLMKKGWGNANQPGKLGLSCARKGEIALHVHEPKISASLTLLSSASLTHIESETLFNVCMDIDEIRRQRLELIIRESGTVKAVAERLGVSPAQVSQWRNQSVDPKTGKPRVMHRNSARRVESLWEKPMNWMDTPIDDAPPGSEEHDIAERFAKLPVEFRAFLLRQGEEMIARLHGASENVQIALADEKAASGQKTADFANKRRREKK